MNHPVSFRPQAWTSAYRFPNHTRRVPGSPKGPTRLSSMTDHPGNGEKLAIKVSARFFFQKCQTLSPLMERKPSFSFRTICPEKYTDFLVRNWFLVPEISSGGTGQASGCLSGKLDNPLIVLCPFGRNSERETCPRLFIGRESEELVLLKQVVKRRAGHAKFACCTGDVVFKFLERRLQCFAFGDFTDFS